MTRQTEVLVVGAGPTGLTLAILLRRLGVTCVVVDKAGGPSTTSKAIGLQYRVSELLSWMGLVDRFLARSATQTTVNLYADGRRITRLVLNALEGRSGKGAFTPRPIILPQSETEALLGDALRESGGLVEWNKELVAFTDADGQVAAQLADGDSISARYLVSCEGAHSVARKLSGIAFEGKTFPHDFIMADVAIDTSLQRGEAHSWMHPAGTVSAITMPGADRWRLFIEAGAFAADDVSLDDVRRIYADRSGDSTSHLTDPTWLTRFKIHSRMVERFRAGRVFLAGDAAHLHSPSGGQGITTGMQDAYNLAWKLAQVIRHGAPEVLLDTYDEERRPAARAVLATTDRNTQLLFATSRIGKWFRNRVFMPLLGTRPVQRRLMSKLSQLDMNYRASALSHQRGGGRLHAGDRAPDVMLRSNGETVSLFQLLGGGRFVALMTGENPGLTTRLQRIGIEPHRVEATADFGKLYGAANGDFWLIRPDGYVGLRCRVTDIRLVADYLSQVWAPDEIERVFGKTSPTPRLVTPHRLAQLGISVQFLALIRTLAEYFRAQSALAAHSPAPLIGGALIASVFAWTAVLFYFGGKDRTAAGVAGVSVLVLLAFKMAAF